MVRICSNRAYSGRRASNYHTTSVKERREVAKRWWPKGATVNYWNISKELRSAFEGTKARRHEVELVGEEVRRREAGINAGETWNSMRSVQCLPAMQSWPGYTGKKVCRRTDVEDKGGNGAATPGTSPMHGESISRPASWQYWDREINEEDAQRRESAAIEMKEIKDGEGAGRTRTDVGTRAGVVGI